MISDNASQDLRKVVEARRSFLDKWFNTDTQNFGQTNKKESILNGAALIINTDPSFWTSLPPGANELMTELQLYK